jgi:hypothetical protein
MRNLHQLDLGLGDPQFGLDAEEIPQRRLGIGASVEILEGDQIEIPLPPSVASTMPGLY